jgi:L-ascorbate metabolism protein UlaG (beta-lactamase superfamily)
LPRNPYYSGPVSDHFDGLRFFPPGGARDKTLSELWRMIRDARRLRAPWPETPPTVPCPAPPQRVEGDRIRVTLVGHSTFLVQTQGVNLLTDPVWASRAGPFGLLGPKRATPPALALEDLPPLDAILLSHNHYDHLDLATLARLARLRPCPVLTPLGNDAILRKHVAGIDARALDWGQAIEVRALRVTLEPALHWSARGRGDRRMALWGSFMIAGRDDAIYFAGDTGYGDGSLFPAIAARHPRIRLALLPIGAYAPRWFMRDQHCDPDEALAIFHALGAERAIACHWGTFRLTDEPYDEPPQRLAEALARAGVAAERFVAPKAGGVVEIG